MNDPARAGRFAVRSLAPGVDAVRARLDQILTSPLPSRALRVALRGRMLVRCQMSLTGENLGAAGP